MICLVGEKIVRPHEITRRYETGPDKHILASDEELESLTQERSRTIESSQFIDFQEIDALQYNNTY